MTNKEASAKQEKMVADYMGWSVITGSGARPFAPGDVSSEHFLVECKTHIEEQSNVVFYKKHWEKIAIESTSVHKSPALITDNGTQRSNHTWVAIRFNALPEDSHIIQGMNNTARSDSTITFNEYDTVSLFKDNYKNGCINYILGKLGTDEVAIMPLSEFNSFYREQYEC